MPHQCLGCGRAFAQGSTELLKGCPDCQGTRFFYSATPIPDAERARLQDQQSADVKDVLARLIAENPDASPRELLQARSWDEWVSVPKSGAAAATPTPEPVAAEPAAPTPAPTATPAPAEASPDAAAAPLVDEPAAPPERTTPGTVQVVAKGSYEIDVEALLDQNPVVVEKDGVFMIHLASAFGPRRGRD